MQNDHENFQRHFFRLTGKQNDYGIFQRYRFNALQNISSFPFSQSVYAWKKKYIGFHHFWRKLMPLILLLNFLFILMLDFANKAGWKATLDNFVSTWKDPEKDRFSSTAIILKL